jgi:FkbH-like protein
LRVSEALRIVQGAPPDAEPFAALLACGCASLHLKTFLHAHLQQRLPQRRVSVLEGLYGDMAGTLERASGQSYHAAAIVLAIVLEYSDLDARLGHRSAAKWSLAATSDILKSVAAALARMAAAIANMDRSVRVALSLPALPLPPLFHPAGTQASEAELELNSQLASFASQVSQRGGLAVVNAQRIAEESPPAGRFDLKSDLLIGFPYTVAYADTLTASCARLLVPTPPKKGIITDLDDTLWSGIVGEVGPEGISWDLSGHHHLHALYQNLLASLSEQGTLVAVASKNDPEVVKSAFGRSDLLLPTSRVFPFEVHWQSKSSSVSRILDTWNIGAADVIFVDDSPMELAEVEAAHPGIQCVQFPQGDYAAGLAMLRRIRDLCGRERITGEDTLRLDSIRQGAEFRRMAADGAVSDSFLERADAVVTIDFAPSPEDTRVLDLVNKTNQFNLNGIRRSDADWQASNRMPNAVVAVVSYADKFGPLGKIAVIQGCRDGAVLHVRTWVMSCRAFSRRVEYQCLRVLFDRFGLTGIRFDFAETPRNGPLQEFFASLLGGKPAGHVTLPRTEFESRCPALFQRLVVTGNGPEEKTWTS